MNEKARLLLIHDLFLGYVSARAFSLSMCEDCRWRYVRSSTPQGQKNIWRNDDVVVCYCPFSSSPSSCVWIVWLFTFCVCHCNTTCSLLVVVWLPMIDRPVLLFRGPMGCSPMCSMVYPWCYDGSWHSVHLPKVAVRWCLCSLAVDSRLSILEAIQCGQNCAWSQ